MEKICGCKITSGHVAILQAFAVVLGVIGILLVGDASYDDHRFSNYVERGEIWEREGTNMMMVTTAFDKVRWVRRESGYYRGKLDWYFLLALILLTIIHIVLVLNLMHEISLTRRKNDVRGYPEGTYGARLSVTTAVTTAACIIGTDTPTGPLAIKRTYKTEKEGNKATTIAAVLSPATSAGLSSQGLEEENESELTLDDPAAEENIDPLLPVLEQQSIALVGDRRKRREQYAKLFAMSAAVISLLTVLLLVGVALEIHLVRQLDDFYESFHNKSSETAPFPSICAISRRNDYLRYAVQGKNDPSTHGICNEYLLKLAGASVGLLIVLISIATSILYTLRYRKMMAKCRQNGPQPPSSSSTAPGASKTSEGGGSAVQGTTKPTTTAERKFSNGNNNFNTDDSLRK